jgi:hypothetical protein
MVTNGESVFYLTRRIVPPSLFSPHFDYNFQSKYPAFLSEKGPRGDVALDDLAQQLSKTVPLSIRDQS